MNDIKAARLGVGILLSVWMAVGCGGKQETPPQETPLSETPSAETSPQDVQGGLGLRGEPKKGALMGNEIKGRSLPKEEIRKTVHANIQQVIDCYESALATDPTLSGKVSIKFIIALDGTLTMAAVAETEINNPDCEDSRRTRGGNRPREAVSASSATFRPAIGCRETCSGNSPQVPIGSGKARPSFSTEPLPGAFRQRRPRRIPASY